jgi:hypothetical protein
LAVGALALALTAAACTSSDSSDAAATPAETTETDAPRTDATPNATSAVGDGESADTAPGAGTAPGDQGVVVPEALQFTAPLVGGGEFSGDTVAGKPTLFWFWAPT